MQLNPLTDQTRVSDVVMNDAENPEKCGDGDGLLHRVEAGEVSIYLRSRLARRYIVVPAPLRRQGPRPFPCGHWLACCDFQRPGGRDLATVYVRPQEQTDVLLDAEIFVGFGPVVRGSNKREKDREVLQARVAQHALQGLEAASGVGRL